MRDTSLRLHVLDSRPSPRTGRFLSAALVLSLLFTGLTAAPRVDASPGPALRIVDAAGNTPVVNEGGRIALRVIDGSSNTVSASSWSTDNKAIGKVKRSNGLLRGKAFGFATVTAQTAQGPVSGFIVCARLRRQNGAMTQGDTKTDASGNVYLSSPSRHVLYKATAASADVFAGKTDESGYLDGTGGGIRLNGPAGIGVDNRSGGGLYVADTANHCVRKIDFRGRSSLAVGTPGFEGTTYGDENPMAEMMMSGPRGVASVGSNMFVTDTGNHCVWYVDVQRGRVQLVAGEPGEAGNTNGEGRAARFNSPSGITVNTRGNLLAIADTGNNVVRLIGIAPRPGSDGGVIGQVTTLGLGSSARNARILEKLGDDRGTDAIAFDAPVSVSFDGVDNVYVIDDQTASVVTRPSAASGRPVQRVDLAQAGTLGNPASVTVQRTQAFVLDESATTNASSINVVEVGAPTILGLSDDSDRLEGGKLVTITGTNFAPEARLTLGDAEVTDYEVRSASEIRFTVPPQQSPGALTLTVATRGGTDQVRFDVVAKSLADIAPGEITTVAGGVRNTGDGGRASQAIFSVPIGLLLDSRGSLLVADATFSRVRRIDRDTGLVTAVAGNGARGDTGDGTLATAARLTTPNSIVFDGGGNLFISDFNAYRIRRVDAVTRVISTVAGTGELGSDGNDGAATAARISGPQGMVIDRRGNLFFADSRANVVRRVDAATGIITNVAGTGVAGDSGDGGPARLARLSSPESLAFDSSGNLYVSERGSLKIRRIDGQTLRISTIAGKGQPGSSGDGGPAVDARLDPGGLAFDDDDVLYVADVSGSVIRRIDAAGVISTIAGTGERGFDGDGGPATSARLSFPRGLAVGAARQLFVSDSGNHRIRTVDLDTGVISTLSGLDIPINSGDGGPATRAHLGYCTALVLDQAGDVIIAESSLDRIRRLRTSDGTIETIAGTGVTGYAGDGGPATSALLNGPKGLAIDPAGRLVFADSFNHCIRRIENGVIQTIAGTGVPDFAGDGGPAANASFAFPTGVVIDDAGSIYVADSGNDRIRRIDAAGTITTIAGTETQGFSGDGGPAVAARLAGPVGLAFDRSSGLLFADRLNNCIRRVDLASGIITRIAGTTFAGSSGDGGPALSARLKLPDWIGIDGVGNVLVSDTDNSRIRRVDVVSKKIEAFAGTGAFGYFGDGGPRGSAELASPEGILVDRAGNVYLADALNGAIRVIRQAAAPTS